MRFASRHILTLLLCGFTSALQSSRVVAQQPAHSFTGIVRDSLRQPVAGASLRIIGTNIGTYTSPKGEFRITIRQQQQQTQVRVNSLGYETVTQTLTANIANEITLKAQPVLLTDVIVTEEISAQEIIRRAIARKQTNRGALISASKQVYSKIQFEATTKNLFRGKASLTTAILETISRIYEQFRPSHTQNTVVLHRRQTANFPPQANIQSIAEIFSLFDDEILIGSTRLRTPLASNALSYYTYTLGERKNYNGLIVYSVQFAPQTRWMPGFEGTLFITERGFALIGAEFSPTNSTSLPAISQLNYKQRYEPFGDSTQPAWIPTFVEADMEASVNFALLGINAHFSLQSIVSDVIVNPSIPRTTLIPQAVTTLSKLQRTTSSVLGLDTATVRSTQLNDSTFLTIALDVDAADDARWRTLTLRERTAQEDSVYRVADSVAEARRVAGKRSAAQIFDSTLTLMEDASSGASLSSRVRLQSFFMFPIESFKMGIEPITITPRTTGFLGGLDLGIQWNQTLLKTQITTNLTRWFGNSELSHELIRWNNGSLQIFSRAFSQVSSVQVRRSESTAFTGIQLLIDYRTFEQHHEFFYEEGFTAGFKLGSENILSGTFNATVAAKLSRQSSMQALEGNANVRANMPIEDGRFGNVHAALRWDSSPLPLFQETPPEPSTTHVSLKLRGVYGSRIAQNDSGSLVSSLQTIRPYHVAEISLYLAQPTFFTGYAPMHLLLIAQGGYTTERTPPQERFLMFKRFAYLGSIGDFLSPGLGAFGGTRYLSFRAEHNFSDLAWRAIGLPTHNGRGIDFILHAGTARYEQESSASVEGFLPQTNGWYSELGFGIGRIPLVFIDLLTLRLDAAWGVGNVGAGNFGWSIGINFSF